MEGILSQLTNVNKVHIACEGLSTDMAAAATASTRCGSTGCGCGRDRGDLIRVGWASELAVLYQLLTPRMYQYLRLQPTAIDGAAEQTGSYRGSGAVLQRGAVLYRAALALLRRDPDLLLSRHAAVWPGQLPQWGGASFCCLDLAALSVVLCFLLPSLLA